MALDAAKDGEDDRLLAAYGGGDPSAARAVSERFLPIAYRFALRILADRTEAEDVAQEAMIRLFRVAAGWQPGPAAVTTWLYQVTANLCTDRLRRRRALPLEAAGAIADKAASVEDRLIAAEREAALGRALADLPDRQRMAVVLRHIEGLANPEIAAIMQIGTEAVESLIARGKRGLTEALRVRRADLGFGHD